MHEAIVFLAGAVFASGIMLVASAGDADLDKCKRKHNVYKCEKVYVPIEGVEE